MAGDEQGRQHFGKRGGRCVDVRIGSTDPGRQTSAEFRLRGLDVGLSQPVRRAMAVIGQRRATGRRRFSLRGDVGPATDPAWAANDPTANAATLVANNTRIWVYTGNGGQSDLEAAGKLDASLLESATRISNKIFQARYKAKGGHNGVFNFPANGTHTWSYWGAQLQAMLPDLRQALGTA
ncbi:antigen 85-C [Mycobacterium kansasii]|uniref:Antigen 85-C n=1 Tax=Mycobacterium kansasii TaxID=1768 RepID=A0A1V3XQI0_MYCKA|nr:antigen 85-C [Mycobacterium kansasii]